MARRGISEERQRAAALQGGLKAISRGVRPAYTVRKAADGRWEIIALPWLVLDAVSRRDALDAARTAVAAFLDVAPDRFDVEVG